MHKIIYILLLVIFAMPVSAQGIIKKTVKAVEEACTPKATPISNRCVTAIADTEIIQPGLMKMLKQKTEQASSFSPRQRIILKKSGLMDLPFPNALDERQLYPLAEAASFLIHPNNPSSRMITERWFKQNTQYAVIYARDKQGSVQDMTAYYVAWLYANCRLHGMKVASYRYLEQVLYAKYCFLNYKELYKEL